jgi:hypothetical protein
VDTTRYVLAALVLMAAAGCGSNQSPEQSPQASPTTSTSSAAPPSVATVATQFDARWMTLTPHQPNGWKELNRTITGDFQQFDFRPVDETEFMRGCNGCAPWTATLTAYSPGKFDATAVQTGQPASVDGQNAFFRPGTDTDDAILAWQYADDAWATAAGLSTTTSNIEQLTQLAQSLKPAERAPIRLPLTFANLPANMPLAQITIDTGPVEDESLDFGTWIRFAGCGLTDEGRTRECMTATPRMDVRIRANDDSGHVQEANAIPVTAGGKAGLFDESTNTAGVQVTPEMFVEFNIGMSNAEKENIDEVKQILADVTWAPNPADEATWPAVTDWTK